MAIYSRLLNGATGPTQRFQVPQSVPYVDDMFDPLFNKEVVDYNTALYGNRIAGTLAGYAQMWDHALTGEGGILGPGMGILSTFGRSMDKADDLILGGLTEGVNALGHGILHGSNDAPTNPVRNIFVEDQDYSGTKLLAAMGNTMAKMAGGAKLDETDFSGLAGRLSGSALDMMTDPGWLGSRLAKGKGTAAEVGSLLDSYDNAMAKVAGNVAFPGMQHLAHQNMERIRRLLAANSPENMMDYSINGNVKWSPESSQALYAEYDNWYKIAEANGDTTPEETATADMIRMYRPRDNAPAPTADVTDASVGRQASTPTAPKADAVAPNYPKYPNVSALYADPTYSDYISNYIADNINAAVAARNKINSDIMVWAGEQAKAHPEWTYVFKRPQKMAPAAYTGNWATEDWFVVGDEDRIGYSDADKLTGKTLFLDYAEKHDLAKKFPDIWEKYSKLKDADGNFEDMYMDDVVSLEKADAAARKANRFRNSDVDIADYTSLDPANEYLSPMQQEILARIRIEDGAHVSTAHPAIYFTQKSAYVQDAVRDNLQQALLATTRRLAAQAGIKDAADKNFEQLTKELFPDAYLNKRDAKDPAKMAERIREQATRMLEYEDEYRRAESSVRAVYKYIDYLGKHRPKALEALLKADRAAWESSPFPWAPTQSTFDPYVLWARDVNKIMDVYGAEKGKRDSLLGRGFDDLLESTPGRTPTEAESKAIAVEAEGINAGAEVSRALPHVAVNGLADLRALADTLPKGLEVRVDPKRLKSLAVDVPDDELPPDARIYIKAKRQIDARTKADRESLEEELAKPEKERNVLNIAKYQKAIAANSYLELTKEERDALDPKASAWYLFGRSYKDKKTGRVKWTSATYAKSFTKERTDWYTGSKYIGDHIDPEKGTGLYRYFYGPATAEYRAHMKFNKHMSIKDPLSMIDVADRTPDGKANTFSLNTGDRDVLQYFLGHERQKAAPFMQEYKVAEDFLNNALEDDAVVAAADALFTKRPKWYATNYWAYAKHAYNVGDKKTALINAVACATKAQREALAKTLNPPNVSADAAPSALAKAVAETAALPDPAKQAELSKALKHSNTVLDMQCQKVIDTVYSDYYSDSPIKPDRLEEWVHEYGTPEQKTLFAYIDAVKRNTILAKRGRNQYKNNADVMEFGKESDRIFNKFVTTDDKGNMTGVKKEVSEYLALRDSLEDQVIAGSDFLTYLVNCGGRAVEKCSAGVSDADYAALKAALQSNVNAVNKAAGGNVLKFVEGKTSDGMRSIGYAFDVSNLDVKKDWNRLFSVFAKPLYLEDALFFRKDKDARVKLDAMIKANPDVAELDALLNNVSDKASYFYKVLGIPMDTSSPSYFHHTMSESPDAAVVFDDVLKSVGLRGTDANGVDFDDDAKLTQIINALENSNAPSLRGQFGTRQYKRAYLGDLKAYGPGFSNDIRTIVADTFTKGTFDNIHANTAQTLFFNDNFGVNQYFETKENLVDAVRQKNEKGLYSGNMANLDLVSPRLDDNGKIVGFTHYDKLSDADMDRAWKSGNAVLVPTEVIGKLDRLLRKNARMSSPAYRFFNKYLTLPFKFGVLANPGFLAGNVQDAWYKQAEVMAEKYDTSIETELANVGMQYRRTVQLNNKFDEVRQKYETFLKNASEAPKDEHTAAIRNAYGKSMGVIKKGGHLDAAVIMQNPVYFSEWVNYMNNELPKDSKELKVAKFYTTLNSYQSLAEFENNRLDLEDVLATSNASRRGNSYDRPTSLIERVLYGDASKRDPEKGMLGNINAYGLALNNPYSDAILKTSNQFESLTRTATILNDLEHRGFTQDKIDDILGNDPKVEKALYQDLHIKTMDAINVMNAANFDYDTVSDLMDKASYVIPFPTFYMKNLAFWLNTLAEHPERLDDIISFQESLWNGVPQKDEYAKEAKGRGAYPIGVGNDHLTGIVKQSPTNSMFGAFNALNNPVGDLSYRLNPVTRPITRHLQDPKDVKYRPYSTDVYEKNIDATSSQFSDLAYMFHQLNPFERFVNTYLRTPRKIATNQAQLSDFAPSMFQPNFNK